LNQNVPDFLNDGGEMGALMRAHDWSSSELGPPADWPQALRVAVRLMLNSGHPMYIWWGPRGACLYNDAYRRSIGPERHPGSLGRPAREVWAEIWDIIGPQIEQVMQGRGATWHENQLVPITRNGKREDVYWTYSYSPIDDRDAAFGVGGVLVICTETTQQVLSLQRSHAELSQFAALFEQAPAFMALLRGPEHRIELANPAYMRLIGRRDLVGRPLADAVPEAAEQGYVALLDQVYRTGEAYVADAAIITLQNPDGGTSERQVDFVYQPITNAAGVVDAIFVQGIDVTGSAAADLMAERLVSIVESSDDAIISKDLNGTIRSWNRGAERIFGYSEEEAVGQPITMLIPAELAGEEPLILSRIIKGERIDHFETTRKRKDGVLIPISVTISPIRDRAGRIVGASKVGRDISVAREAQEQQSLLFREMDHRIKNLFAVAGGVVSVSARQATDVKDLAKTIQSRLSALARAQALTLSPDAGGTTRKASLREVARAILSPYDTGSGHIAVAGPELECGASATTSVALLLHEFATNSIKYGALSTASGRVSLSWEIGDALALAWHETGGPSAGAPQDDKLGFGSVLVAATVDGLRGTISRDWRSDGLCIRVTAPLSTLSR
jgi:PAS domain S-box-containing protein